MGAKGNQVVIYSMVLDADSDLAMILPIPVKAGSPEKSVKFIDLSLDKNFFPMLDRAFPQLDTFGGRSSSGPFGGGGGRGRLEVQQVGSFDASFVPTVSDFDRVDPEFRIEQGIWASLPEFKDHGFVVFKLRKGRARVHPMAFAYPARDTGRIVFPTVHIHDGEVHGEAKFDHSLYCQTSSPEVKMQWQESVALAAGYLKILRLKGTVRGDEHVYKKQFVGAFENQDMSVASS